MFQPARKERMAETAPQCVKDIVRMAAILWPENATTVVNQAGTPTNVILVSLLSPSPPPRIYPIPNFWILAEY